MEQENASYLNYLPDIYRRTVFEEHHTFLENYLKIFQKILSGINDNELDHRKGISQLLDADIIGNLFYPRFSFLFPKVDHTFIPPLNEAELKEFNTYIGSANSNSLNFNSEFYTWLNEFLNWLASWIDFTLFEDWSLNKKREIIAKMLPIFRIRGTQRGLQQLLDLCVNQELLEVKVENGIEATKLQVGINTVLKDEYQTGDPLVGGLRPRYFYVEVKIKPETDEQFVQDAVQNEIAIVKNLIERLKPESSYYIINIKV